MVNSPLSRLGPNSNSHTCRTFLPNSICGFIFHPSLPFTAISNFHTHPEAPRDGKEEKKKSCFTLLVCLHINTTGGENESSAYAEHFCPQLLLIWYFIANRISNERILIIRVDLTPVNLCAVGSEELELL